MTTELITTSTDLTTNTDLTASKAKTSGRTTRARLVLAPCLAAIVGVLSLAACGSSSTSSSTSPAGGTASTASDTTLPASTSPATADTAAAATTEVVAPSTTVALTPSTTITLVDFATLDTVDVLTVTSCTSDSPQSIHVQASNDSQHTLTVDVAEGAGTFTYFDGGGVGSGDATVSPGHDGSLSVHLTPPLQFWILCQ